MPTIYAFSGTSLSGEPVELSRYKGQVLLIVNTASKCGFTPQYQGLEKLYQKYRDQGLTILGFPCNQFGKQEPGKREEIASFCSTNYGVSFPMFDKIDVNGKEATPLYQYLKRSAPGVINSKCIKWNFTKFLVDASGEVIKRFGPSTKPEALESAISPLLSS